MQKWIWNFFYLLAFVIFIHSIGLLFGVHLSRNIVFHLLLLVFPVILFVLHSVYTLGFYRSGLFMLLASGVGWFMETMGLKYGFVFGGRYIYEANQLMIGTVPISVVLYWAVFTYTGYSIINSFLYWLHQKKPIVLNAPIYKIIPFVIGDGLVVTIIDLFMDPIQVKTGAWQWLDGGSYFGVPIGNFIGWFSTVVVITGVFRLYEYLVPAQESKKEAPILMLPTIGYGMLAVSFAFSAFQLKLYSLMIIGIALMAPTVLVNFYLYANYLKISSK